VKKKDWCKNSSGQWVPAVFFAGKEKTCAIVAAASAATRLTGKRATQTKYVI
jgi:hypothetical protein